MNEQSKGGLGALFLYIGVGIALLFTVISGIRTVFSIIDHLVSYEHAGWYQLYNSTEMPVNAAFLMIAFIVLVIIIRKTRGIVDEYQGTIWYTLCRTIIFIILTVSVALIAIATSILFGDILSGEISLNNLCKTVFVASVGSAIFYYYRGVLRGAWRTKKKQERMFVVAASILVGLILLSTIIVFNPFERAALKRTYEKLDCMQSITSAVTDSYFDEKRKEIPTTESYIEFIENNRAMYHHIHEQEECDSKITYEMIDTTHYRLCASFEVLPKGVTVRRYPYKKFEVKEVGQNCFDLDVEKQ